MRSIPLHAWYSLKQLSRQEQAWLRLLLLVPVAELLPFLLMGRALLTDAQAESFFYTNLAWMLVAGSVLQGLVWFQVVTQTGRLDVLVLAEGGLAAWVAGFTLALWLMFCVSTGVSALFMAFVLCVPVRWVVLLVLFVATVPISLGMVFFALGVELYLSRIFHIVNLALDGLMVVSCVFYPLSLLGAYLRPIAILSPSTWLNEFVRDANVLSLVVAVLLSGLLVGISMTWMTMGLKRYRRLGSLGKERQ